MSKIILTGVTGSFVNLHEPAKEGKSKGKYGMQISFPKDSKNTQAFINGMNEALKEASEKDPSFKRYLKKSYVPVEFTLGQSKFLQDGDDKYNSKGEQIEMLQGCFCFQPTSKKQPVIIGLDRKPMIDTSIIYSGDFFNIRVNASFFSNKEHGTKGIGLYLAIVQPTFTGTNISGGTVSEEEIENDFDILEETSSDKMSDMPINFD